MRDKLSTYFIRPKPLCHCEDYVVIDFHDLYQTRLSSMATKIIHLAYNDELAYLQFISPFTMEMR